MNLIQGLTDAPLQTQTLVLPDGTTLSLDIYFMPMQQVWMIQNLTYGNFQINNRRICISPNLLYQFTEQIPFGIACFTKDGREPELQGDFASGNANLYL